MTKEEAAITALIVQTLKTAGYEIEEPIPGILGVVIPGKPGISISISETE